MIFAVTISAKTALFVVVGLLAQGFRIIGLVTNG